MTSENRIKYPPVKFVSVVVPMLNEEENVRELVHGVNDVLDGLHYDSEIILINDGSCDNTWNTIMELSCENARIKGLDLAGNYGQTIALRAGFKEAKGDVIIAMDGDLQHDPKYIPEFLKYIEMGYDMVGGAKENRPEGWLTRQLSDLAHAIICRLSGVNLKYFGATFKAYRSYLLKNSNLIGDAHRFLGAIVAKDGIRYTEFPIDIQERKAGQSNYNLSKVFLVLVDLFFLKFFVSYMNKPFRLFGVSGGIILFVGLVLTSILTFGSLFFNFHIKEDYIAEFLFSIFLMLFGLLLVSFGLIAEIGIHNYYTKGNEPYTIRNSANL